MINSTSTSIAIHSTILLLLLIDFEELLLVLISRSLFPSSNVSDFRLRLCMYICMYASSVSTYVCMHVCLYIYMYVYIYMMYLDIIKYTFG